MRTPPNANQAFEVFKNMFFVIARSRIRVNYLKNPEEKRMYVEEIMNDGFFEFWEKHYPLFVDRHGDNPEKIFSENKGLVITILNSLAFKIHRENQKRKGRSSEFNSQDHENNITRPNLFRENKERMNCIKMHCGSPMYEIVELMDQGYKKAEITKILGISDGNLRVILFRNRKLIKKYCL